MKDCYKLMLLCALSMIIYFILPRPYDILISFFISSISLSIFYSKNSFNVYVFLICLFLVLLFPSNWLTLDVNSVYQFVGFLNTTKNVINVVGTIICVGIPTLLIGVTIASFVTLQFDKAISLLIKTIVVIGFIIAVTWILSFFGIDLFDWRKSALELWNNVSRLFGNLSNQFSSDMNASQNFRIEMLFTTFPIFLAIAGIGSAIFFAFKKQSEKEAIMSKISEKESIQINRPNDRGQSSQSIQFIIFFAIFIIIVLGLGLYYNIDEILTYRNQLYFSIYSIIIVGIIIMLAMGIGCYTKNTKQTFLGIILGVFGLFCFFNLFNQAKTFEMLALENPTILVQNIVSQVLFVAPMESLLFHVFLPGLVLYLILLSKKRYDQDAIRLKLLQLESKRDYYVSTIEVYRTSNSKSKSKDIQKAETELFKVQKQIRQQQFLLESPVSVESGKSFTTNNIVVYIVAMIGFQAIFSFFHWFNSTLSIGVFFNSGLFFLYLSAGSWMGYLSYRFGWTTAIIVHAINNCLSLILMLITIGVH